MGAAPTPQPEGQQHPCEQGPPKVFPPQPYPGRGSWPSGKPRPGQLIADGLAEAPGGAQQGMRKPKPRAWDVWWLPTGYPGRAALVAEGTWCPPELPQTPAGSTMQRAQPGGISAPGAEPGWSCLHLQWLLPAGSALLGSQARAAGRWFIRLGGADPGREGGGRWLPGVFPTPAVRGSCCCGCRLKASHCLPCPAWQPRLSHGLWELGT